MSGAYKGVPSKYDQCRNRFNGRILYHTIVTKYVEYAQGGVSTGWVCYQRGYSVNFMFTWLPHGQSTCKMLTAIIKKNIEYGAKPTNFH